MEACKYNQCDRQAYTAAGKTAGYCTGHAAQIRRGLEPTPLAKRSRNNASLEDRLLLFSEKTDSCWLWTGTRSTNGYGNMHYKGFNTGVHRLAYTAWIGEIPDNSVVHHSCTVRHCINPAHLQLVSQQENLVEMLERKSYKRQIKELERQVKDLERELKRTSNGS